MSATFLRSSKTYDFNAAPIKAFRDKAYQVEARQVKAWQGMPRRGEFEAFGGPVPLNHKRGGVLVLVLVLVMLMAMMAFGVAMNTKTELSISSNSDLGRRAFLQADSALKMSVLISRILLFPSSGKLDDFLPDGGDFEIEANVDDFDVALMRWNQEGNSYKSRYLKAGARTEGISLASGTGSPLITFKAKNPANPSQSRVVATSAVSLDYAESDWSGASLESGSYQLQGVKHRTIIIVTTDGRVPTGNSFHDSEDSAFFDGTSDTTHTILTTAFQEVR
ncbi:MAG: hypothetical protein LBT62_03505 [Deltaproteobacteria bacterium]|jgi:hypothetical protein|nr:hypothetical protein [Deltaproteobacteria bacterium]